MKPLNTRKNKPTLQTAHDWVKGIISYGMGEGDYLTTEERISEIESVREELEQLVKKEFPRTKILEYAILKSHLIIEHAVSQYIRCLSTNLVPLESLHFTFSQKVEIACFMGFGLGNPVVLPTIELLNKARNQVAHKFSLDTQIIDEMLRINSDDYDSFRIESDIERIRFLRNNAAFLCGYIAGGIDARLNITEEQYKNFVQSRP